MAMDPTLVYYEVQALIVYGWERLNANRYVRFSTQRGVRGESPYQDTASRKTLSPQYRRRIEIR